MFEVEVRAKIPGESIHKILEGIGAKKGKSDSQNDEYFKFGKDDERRVVIRIRKKGNKTALTFKGSSKLAEDVAWQEWENEITDSESLKKLMLSNGFVPVVTINKKRTTYNFNSFEVNVDDIEQLGEFVEVELKSENPEKAKEEIKNFLRDQLKIPEQNIITKGYVQLMLEIQK